MNFDSTPEIIVAAVIGLLSLQAIRKFCGYPVKGNIAQMIVSFSSCYHCRCPQIRDGGSRRPSLSQAVTLASDSASHITATTSV